MLFNKSKNEKTNEKTKFFLCHSFKQNLKELRFSGFIF